MISLQLHTQLHLSTTISLVSHKNEPLPGIYFTQDSLKRFYILLAVHKLYSLKMYTAFLSITTHTHTHIILFDFFPLTTTNSLLQTSV